MGHADVLSGQDFGRNRSEFDLSYQLSRLRHGRDVPDGEIETIFATIAANLQTYEQVIELLALLPAHHGGLLPLALGLFHPNERIQDATLVILDKLKVYQVSNERNWIVDMCLTNGCVQVGNVFLASLNAFQRFAYHRLVQERDGATAGEALT